MTARRSIRALLGLLLGGVCLWWVLHDVATEDIGEALSETRWSVLPVLALLFMAQQFLRAWRQQILVQGVNPDSPYRDNLSILCISFFCINTFPARLGELVRPALLRDRQGVPLGSGFGVIFVERLLDLCSTLLLLVAVAWWGNLAEAEIEIYGGQFSVRGMAREGALLVIPLLLVLGLLLALALRGKSLVGILSRAGRFGRWAGSFVGPFLEGVAVLGRPRRTLGVLGLTAVIWAGTGWMYVLLANAVGIGAQVGYLEGLGVLALTMLCTALPSPPGFVGVYEAGVLAALGLFGVAGPEWAATALVFALVMHWWTFTVQALSALWFFLADEVGLGEVFAYSRRSQMP